MDRPDDRAANMVPQIAFELRQQLPPHLHILADEPDNVADKVIATTAVANADERVRLLLLVVPDQCDLNLECEDAPKQVLQALAGVLRNFDDPREPVLLPNFQ